MHGAWSVDVDAKSTVGVCAVAAVAVHFYKSKEPYSEERSETDDAD